MSLGLPCRQHGLLIDLPSPEEDPLEEDPHLKDNAAHKEEGPAAEEEAPVVKGRLVKVAGQGVADDRVLQSVFWSLESARNIG